MTEKNMSGKINELLETLKDDEKRQAFLNAFEEFLTNYHQPAFAVGEYYFYKSMENVLHILKITAVMGNIVEAGFLDTETGKLINTRIELDKKYVQPATAEQIATFQRAEHFASKGRKLDEFRDRDIVKYEGELFFAKTT
ncbi:hypothetical protein, partial [Enterococcus rotai]|uniref:hypothetical protein n=1 Tax=Enterococcus rotai TaxID=118060 RepID=UPI0035C6B96A